jgi:hypothetical protein
MALLVWREYRAPRARLIAGVILLFVLVLVGNDTLLMALGGIYLLATVVARYIRQHRRRAMPTLRHAQTPAR